MPRCAEEPAWVRNVPIAAFIASMRFTPGETSRPIEPDLSTTRNRAGLSGFAAMFTSFTVCAIASG
jgi:hypothetical protein